MSKKTTLVLLIVVLIGFTGPGVSLPQPKDVTAQADQSEQQGPEISFTRQPSDGTTVVVDDVNLSTGGFVAIHDTSAEAPTNDLIGSVIGVSRFLSPGTHENVTITLAQPLNGTESTRVIAMPHRDTNRNRVFDFVISNGTVDVPFRRGGSPVADPATLDLTDEPIPPEAAIKFENQSANQSVIVESVYLSDGGFVSIVDEEGNIVGVSRHLSSETHQEVRIQLVEPVNERTNLTARVHLDTNDDLVFGFDISNGNVDRPYQTDGRNVTDTARIRVRRKDGEG